MSPGRFLWPSAKPLGLREVFAGGPRAVDLSIQRSRASGVERQLDGYRPQVDEGLWAAPELLVLPDRSGDSWRRGKDRCESGVFGLHACCLMSDLADRVAPSGLQARGRQTAMEFQERCTR